MYIRDVTPASTSYTFESLSAAWANKDGNGGPLIVWKIMGKILSDLCSQSDDLGDLGQWWFTKITPGVANDEREIIVFISNMGQVIGYSILKRTPKERKFTLNIDRSYSNDTAVVRKIVELSFKWLGSSDRVYVYVPADVVHEYEDNIFNDSHWEKREKGPSLFSNDVLGGYLIRPRNNNM